VEVSADRNSGCYISKQHLDVVFGIVMFSVKHLKRDGKKEVKEEK